MITDIQTIHKKWMSEAIRLAQIAYEKDEIPVGAIVIKDNKIIGRGYNQREILKDPTAHAEVLAITAAADTIEDQRLNDCVGQVTKEPCAMCAGAMILARLERLVYGAPEIKTGAHSSIFNILDDPRVNHRIDVIPGVLRTECSYLMSTFFEEMRKRN